MSLKAKIHKACIQQLDEKITTLKTMLTDLTEGVKNDSKSSAGDKHETAQAMMQIEHEKISRQLNDALSQKAMVEQIDPLIHSSVVGTGSLLKTNMGYLFMSAALGKIKIDGTEFIALSMQSPLGQKLVGLQGGHKAEINGTQYLIEELL